jgi:hypothetical protein
LRTICPVGLTVQPDQTFRGTAERNPQLVNGKPLAKIFDFRASSHPRILTYHPFNVSPGIEDADRMEIQPFRF